MAVSGSTPDDGPAGLAAGPHAPRQDRDGPGLTAADHEKEKEIPVVDSSEDEHHHSDIEADHERRQDQPAAGSDPEKTVDNQPLSRRSSSVFANTNTVPRAQRRGLLGRFTIIPEVERPYEYKNRTKWMITAIVALAAAGAPMGSGIFLRKCPYCLFRVETT